LFEEKIVDFIAYGYNYLEKWLTQIANNFGFVIRSINVYIAVG